MEVIENQNATSDIRVGVTKNHERAEIFVTHIFDNEKA